MYRQNAVRAEFIDQRLKARADHVIHRLLHRLLQAHARQIIPLPCLAGKSRDGAVGFFRQYLLGLVHQIKAVDDLDFDVAVLAQAFDECIGDAFVAVTGKFSGQYE